MSEFAQIRSVSLYTFYKNNVKIFIKLLIFYLLNTYSKLPYVLIKYDKLIDEVNHYLN